MAALARRWGGFRKVPDHTMMHTLVHESLGRDISERLRSELLIASGMVSRRGTQTTSRTPLASEEREALPGHIADVEKGLAFARELDDVNLQYRAYEVLSLLYWHAGNVAKYREVNDLESRLLDRLPSRRERIDVMIGQASIHMDMGEYEGALAVAEQAFEQSEGLSLHERMHASFQLMWSATVSGHWDRALEIWPWHLEAAAEEADVNCPNVRGGPVLGATLLTWRGELDRALELAPIGDEPPKRDSMFDRAILANYAVLANRPGVANAIVDSMAANPDRLVFPDGADFFVEALVGLGRYEQIERILPTVREMSSTSAALGPISDRAQAQVHLARGDTDRAAQLLRAALARCDELGIPFEAARTREMLANVAAEPERVSLLQEALATFERLGAQPFAERARSALG
jgi:tetratricopeptide (TPR) repeat protein